MVGPRSTLGRTPPRALSSTSPSPNPKPRDTPITAPPDAEVIRLFPEPTVRLKVEDVYRGISFPARDCRPYVLINMVASLDGKASVGGKAGAIGSKTDRTLMRSLRSCVDAVMIGAGTLRAEGLRLDVPENLAHARVSRGLKPQPLAVLATRSGDVPIEANLLDLSPDNLLVLTTPETPKERLVNTQAFIEVVPGEIEDARLNLGITLEILKNRYAVDVLLVEGGPSLNHALVRAGLVDELFLTLAPKLLGGARTGSLTILEGSAIPLQESPKPELVSAHLSNDELFLRYAVSLA